MLHATLPVDIGSEYVENIAELPIADNNLMSPAEQGFSVDVAAQPVEGGFDPAFGTITWQTLISGETGRSSGLVLGIATCAAFGTLNLHRHTPPEFYFGLSGRGTVTIEGVNHVLRAGVAIYIPGNAEHGIMAGAEGLSFAYGFGETAFNEIEYRFS